MARIRDRSSSVYQPNRLVSNGVVKGNAETTSGRVLGTKIAGHLPSNLEEPAGGIPDIRTGAVDRGFIIRWRHRWADVRSTSNNPRVHARRTTVRPSDSRHHFATTSPQQTSPSYTRSGQPTARSPDPKRNTPGTSQRSMYPTLHRANERGPSNAVKDRRANAKINSSGRY